MRTVFIFTIALSLALPAYADAPATPAAQTAQPAWERIGDDDGIAVYRREVPGSPIVAFKGEGIVDASILRVAMQSMARG